MDFKTILLDPTSSTSQRAVWTISPGIKFFTQKLRIVNTRILNSNSEPIYFGTRGVYSIIKQVSVSNMSGTMIDTLSTMDWIGLKNQLSQNSTQQYIGRVTRQNACVSVDCPSMSQVVLTDVQGKEDATKIWLHIDLSYMLDYLMNRFVANEGLQIMVEWENTLTTGDLSGVGGSWYFAQPPVLAYDEVISAAIPVDNADAFTFNTIVQDRIVVPVTAVVAGGAVPTQSSYIQTRLNAFANCFIGRLAYFDATSNIDGKFNRATYLPYAVRDEFLNIFVDGKIVLPNNGIDTSARKLSSYSDFMGDPCLPTAPAYYWGVEVPDSATTTEPWGLVNQNLDLVMNANLSYGSLGLYQFIRSDLVINYGGKFLKTATSQAFHQLVFLAEVRRVYSPKTGIVSNVFVPLPKPGM